MLIREAVENEIDKITGGNIPEFRDSFRSRSAEVVCAANEVTSDLLEDKLP